MSFDPHSVIYSQYANAPTLVRVVEDTYSAIEKETLFREFESYVYNVDTAVGFGLDIWGRIVDIGRSLQVVVDDVRFGFDEGNSNDDYAPFNQAPFFSGKPATDTFVLADDAYRVLVIAKAMANISACDAHSLNRLLLQLFPGRGRAYVQDQGNMQMKYFFEFRLTPLEKAILFTSNIMPHPAGVEVSYETGIQQPVFGFKQALPDSRPFNVGTFYIPGV